jgi:hypothetical protein
VHCTTSHAQITAASTPHAWIAMCAGVQNVSRPIDRCQETSHAPPIDDDVTANAPIQMYQGTDGEALAASTVSPAPTRVVPSTLDAFPAVDISPPETVRVDRIRSSPSRRARNSADHDTIIAGQPEDAELLRVRNTEANKDHLVEMREDSGIDSDGRGGRATARAVKPGLLLRMRTAQRRSETNGCP